MPIPVEGRDHENHAKPQRVLSLFLKCIIMSLVLSLFLLFLGFAALVLLHFLLSSAAFHRRSSRPPPASPLDLPSATHRGPHRDCAICLDSVREGDLCRSLPGCGHLFHLGCVDSWLKRVLNCPVCRAPVRVHSGSNDQWNTWWPVAV